MRVIFCIPALFLLAYAAIAQKIIVSEDLPLRNDQGYQVIGELKGNLLLFRDKSNNFEIQGFDKKMRLSWTKEIELDKRYPKVLDILPANDYFTLFYRFRNKSHTILKAHRYDPGANLMDSAVVFDFGFLFFTPEFEVKFSEDKTKALVYYLEDFKTIKAFSFDVPSMRLLWNQAVVPDDFVFNKEFFQVTVNNDGDMYFIVDRENQRSKKEEHLLEMVKYGLGLSNPISFKVPMEGRLTYDVTINYDNRNDRFVAAGLYTDKNPARAEGQFTLNFDFSNPADYTLHFGAFPDNLVQDLMGKEADKNNTLTDIEIREIILRQDGGTLLVGERNKEYERRSSARMISDQRIRFSVDYYFDDLFVIATHPDGKYHWHTVLHKKQYSQDDDGIFSSYFLMRNPSKLRFVFNDEIKFENTVSEYTLDPLGKPDRNSLLNTENLDIKMRFRDALQIGPSEFIAPSERRSMLKLVKISY